MNDIIYKGSITGWFRFATNSFYKHFPGFPRCSVFRDPPRFLGKRAPILVSFPPKYEPVFPPEGKTLGPERGYCFSSAPTRKWLVFSPPARRTSAAIDAEIETSTRRQRIWGGFGSKSTPAGVTASRPAVLKKRGRLFSSGRIFAIVGPRKTNIQ